MAFDPARGALACAACGHARLLPEPDAEARTTALREQRYLQALRREDAEESSLEAVVVDCPSCGAQTRFDSHVVGDRCAFCASPLLTQLPRSQRLLRPQAMVPFVVDKAAAHRLFEQWAASRWFAPQALATAARAADGVKGVYTPWWTYDAKTVTTYRGQRGEDERERDPFSPPGENRTRVVTRWRTVSGAVPVDFDDLLVAASPTLPSHLARALDRWDLRRLVPVADELLVGFTVEVYRTGLEEGFEETSDTREQQIDAAIRRDIGGDAQRIHARQTAVDAIRFKHLLLPLWIGSYRFRGKPYRVVVNGQSGEVEGDRPWSVWKIVLVALLVLIVVLVSMQFQQR
jgi:hypothetical protein